MYASEVKLVPILAMFVFLTVAVILGYHTGSHPAQAKAAPFTVADTPASQERNVDVKTTTPPTEKYPTLTSDMNAAIAASPSVSAAATLIDLDTGTAYNAGNYTQNYEAASTAKLVAVFDYLHQVELGKTALTKTIQGDTAQDLIQRMIVNSDNDAWTKLNMYLTMKQEQAYANSLGLTGTVLQVNNIQFTTASMAKLLQLLYQGKLLSPQNQALVYGYMAHTTMNKLIPAALPVDATIYHKYGQIDGVLHDAAIVQYQGHNFVLVVYTDNPAGTSGQSGTQTNLIHAVTSAALTDITGN